MVVGSGDPSAGGAVRMTSLTVQRAMFGNLVAEITKRVLLPVRFGFERGAGGGKQVGDVESSAGAL